MIHQYFKHFLVLIFNIININRYNPHKQNVFGSSIILKNIKGSWHQRVWELLFYVNGQSYWSPGELNSANVLSLSQYLKFIK